MGVKLPFREWAAIFEDLEVLWKRGRQILEAGLLNRLYSLQITPTHHIAILL